MEFLIGQGYARPPRHCQVGPRGPSGRSRAASHAIVAVYT